MISKIDISRSKDGAVEAYPVQKFLAPEHAKNKKNDNKKKQESGEFGDF